MIYRKVTLTDPYNIVTYLPMFYLLARLVACFVSVYKDLVTILFLRPFQSFLRLPSTGFLHVSIWILSNGRTTFRSIPPASDWVAHEVWHIMNWIRFVQAASPFYPCILYRPKLNPLLGNLWSCRYGVLNERTWATVLGLPLKSVIKKHPESSSRMQLWVARRALDTVH